MSTSPEADPHETMEPELLAACVILGLAFVVGAPGNLFVIWIILRHIKERSHTLVLILHLAVADVLVLLTLPLWIYSFAHSWVFGLASCKAGVFVVHACMYASVFLITIMSIERFVAVRYPFASMRWKRKQAINKLSLVVWLASFFLSIPVLLTRTLGDTDGMCLYNEYSSDMQEILLLLLEIIMGFVAPLAILVICYSCLYSRIAQMNFKSKRNSSGLVAGIVIAFVICWMPHHIVNILSLVSVGLETTSWKEAEDVEKIRQPLMMIAGAMAFLSSSINPVLYVFAARSFRSSLRDTGIQKLFRHISSAATEGSKDLSFTTKKQNSHTQSSICDTKDHLVQVPDICDQTLT